MSTPDSEAALGRLDPDGDTIEAVIHGKANRSAQSVEITFEG